MFNFRCLALNVVLAAELELQAIAAARLLQVARAEEGRIVTQRRAIVRVRHLNFPFRV